MSIRRIAVLLGKEISQGWRNVIFIFAIVTPVVLTIIVSLLFGTVFSGKARLGVADLGASELTTRALALAALDIRTYDSPQALRAATASGSLDLGIVLPANFDESIRRGEAITLTAYAWGESTLKNRAVTGATLASLVREIAGQEVPVDIVTSVLGDGGSVPWEARLMPLIVLMAIILGGSIVPAASIVEEKQKRTLRALTTTPASLGEVFAAKGVLGAIVSIVMGAATLILNRAWGPQPALLLATLVLGAIMAACIGILLGAFVKDINTMFTVVKGGGILLYAPAFVHIFPELPQWIGRIFPTYYLIQPVVEITQHGGAWASVAPELVMLIVLDVALIAIITAVVHHAPQSEGALNPA